MIVELSKYNDKWLNIAFLICRDRDLSKDFVQEMYLKVYDISLKKELVINDGYIYRIIKNLFINYCREKKDLPFIDEIYNEIPEEENDGMIFEIELTPLESKVFEMKKTLSYRQIQKETGMNYQYARRVMLKLKSKYEDKKKETLH